MSMNFARVPVMLTASRLVLGPLVLGETISGAPQWAIGCTLTAGLLSDIFDGVIARRMKVVTAQLRTADSRADGVYTFSIIAAICLHLPSAVIKSLPSIALIAALEAATTIYDFRKYGRPCSHHAITAKLWAASFFALALSTLVFGRMQPLLSICVAFGVLNNLEGFVIRALLPRWAYDVSGIPAALRIRREQLAHGELQVADAPIK